MNVLRSIVLWIFRVFLCIMYYVCLQIFCKCIKIYSLLINNLIYILNERKLTTIDKSYPQGRNNTPVLYFSQWVK